jgi:hypothetical protein
VSDVRERSWLEVRWRQFRNPPVPVLRAVLANLTVGIAGGILLVAYDVALSRGAALPGGDQRALAVAVYVALVALAGSALTYLWVLLPSGSGGARRRSGWSALLGLFAALPIAYLVLVVAFQAVAPLFR